MYQGPEKIMDELNSYNASGKSAVILAGGLGTRLRTAVSDMPKCMAPVAGKPFLEHVINYLLNQGINEFVFALGYMHESISSWLLLQYPNLNYRLSLEEEPLGTGGAINRAIQKVHTLNTCIINGDTIFKANLTKLWNYHCQQQAACTLALKPLKHFDRYGAVEMNANGQIQGFLEKKPMETGLINAGMYMLNIPKFLSLDFPEKFSFEKDYLEIFYKSQKMCGLIQDAYFIDIGIPEDFARANIELL